MSTKTAMTIDRYQGIDESGRKFGYIAVVTGGWFFTWMPTLEATIDSLEIDQQDGDGDVERDDAAEFLRSKIAHKFDAD